MTSVILDTETTGLPKPRVLSADTQPRIIEIGAVKVNASGQIVDTLSQLINPLEQIEEIITKITGITNADLAKAPTFADEVERLKAFFADADEIIAHNAPFDESMVGWEMERLGMKGHLWPAKAEVICSVQEFKHYYGYEPKLTKLYEDVMGRELDQTHRAIDDARALYEVLEREGFFG